MRPTRTRRSIVERLAGRVILTTGAGSGLGLALARELAREGAKVALADVRAEGLESARRVLGRHAHSVSFHQVDVSDADRAQACVQEVVAEHGRVDVLVNNAGIAIDQRFEDLDLASFDRVMGVNLLGAVHMTHAALPHLRERDDSMVVNVSSIGAYGCAPGYGAYSASKYALRALTETLGLELHRSPVHVLGVYPGAVSTGLNRHSVEILGDGPSTADPPTEPTRGITPERAAAEVVRAMKRGRRRVFVGLDAKLLYAIERVSPTLLGALIVGTAARAGVVSEERREADGRAAESSEVTGA
jgi:NAD(P)-dependent dehydrogenase (short-subunit alcohol dehydrogenase family)